MPSFSEESGAEGSDDSDGTKRPHFPFALELVSKAERMQEF